MAASGLGLCDDVTRDMSHVVAVVEFAFALKRQLKEVNEHSWNNFKLRIGAKYLEFCAFRPRIFNAWRTDHPQSTVSATPTEHLATSIWMEWTCSWFRVSLSIRSEKFFLKKLNSRNFFQIVLWNKRQFTRKNYNRTRMHCSMVRVPPAAVAVCWGMSASMHAGIHTSSPVKT